MDLCMTGRLKANIADVPWLNWPAFTFHMHQYCSRLREEMTTLQAFNLGYIKGWAQGSQPCSFTLGFSQKSPCGNVARNQNIFGKDLSFKPNVTTFCTHWDTWTCQESKMQMPLARDVYVWDCLPARVHMCLL